MSFGIRPIPRSFGFNKFLCVPLCPLWLNLAQLRQLAGCSYGETMKFSRRDFLATTALTSAAMATGIQSDAQEKDQAQHTTKRDHKPRQTVTMALTEPAAYKRPVIICKPTGTQGIDVGYDMLRNGQDTLDAVLHVCKVQEDDPNDDSVCLGGLPNEEGVVELDACCMHGPTRRAGSVGGVRNIKNVCLVAKAVMQHTGHVMLVGEGAERFAVAMGFPRENLLTENSRKIWMLWKQFHSTNDWWGPGLADPHWIAPDTKPRSDLWQERYSKLAELAADIGIAPELRHAAIR